MMVVTAIYALANLVADLLLRRAQSAHPRTGARHERTLRRAAVALALAAALAGLIVGAGGRRHLVHAVRSHRLRRRASACAAQPRPSVRHRRIRPRRAVPRAGRRASVARHRLRRDAGQPGRSACRSACSPPSIAAGPEAAIMRAVDLLISLPPILLGLLILAVTPPSLWQNHPGGRAGLRPDPAAPVARGGARPARGGFRAGGARPRRGRGRHPVARNPAQCLAADHRRVRAARDLRDPAGRGAVLPRPRPAAAEQRMGADDRGEPAIPRPGAVALLWRPACACACCWSPSTSSAKVCASGWTRTHA